MNISWVEKVSNREVLDRVCEERCIIGNIRKRKRNWIGHISRGSGANERNVRGQCGRE